VDRRYVTANIQNVWSNENVDLFLYSNKHYVSATKFIWVLFPALKSCM